MFILLYNLNLKSECNVNEKGGYFLQTVEISNADSHVSFNCHQLRSTLWNDEFNG